MTRLKAILIAAALVAAGPASAQNIVEFYQTWIGPEDFFNSSGARLSDPCTIVRQERANFHRFGIRHPGDESDALFGNPGNRAWMEGKCRFRSSGGWVLDHLRRGEPVYIRVHVIGSGGRLSHLEILEGAG